MQLILALVLILILSYLGVLLGRKLKIPGVVMLIVVGLIFNFGFLNRGIISGNEKTIFTLGNVGLLALMFLAGLEVSWRQLYREKKDAALIAVFASITPFTLGFLTFTVLGFRPVVAAMVGISMSITAEATKARVLIDLGKIKTRVGAAMMGAGILDDFVGLGMFIIVSFFFGAWSAKHLLTLGVTAMFFAGIIFHKEVRTNVKRKSQFEKILLFGLVPFFFVAMGIHFQFSSLVLDPWLLLIMVVVAIVGKILGVFLTKSWTHFKQDQLFVIGWAMNSRGAIELALALIALEIGLLSVELYSSIIVMTLITTLIFPFIITRMIKKNPRIMD